MRADENICFHSLMAHVRPVLGCSCDLLFMSLLGGKGGEDVGLAGVKLHHLLGDKRVLSSLLLEVLSCFYKVRVGHHFSIFSHFIDHSLIVALEK